MDRKGFAETLKITIKKASYPVAGLVAGAILLTLGMNSSEARMRIHLPVSLRHSRVARLIRRYESAWNRIQEKIDNLKRADEENRKLRAENAHLRLVLESRRYSCYADHAKKLTHDFELKLSRETGSKTGRTLASIPYKVPMDLMPNQLYSLGVFYFGMREDEKAAVILTFLTGLDDEDRFKTPRNYLMTGIAWYRLQNLELADYYFDKVLKAPQAPEIARIQNEVRLWKGLVAYRLGDRGKAQRWLRDVLDHDPHSAEAAWVNTSEVGREPADSE